MGIIDTSVKSWELPILWLNLGVLGNKDTSRSAICTRRCHLQYWNAKKPSSWQEFSQTSLGRILQSSLLS